MRKYQSIALGILLSVLSVPASASEGEVVQHLALFEISSDGVHDQLARQLSSALREAVRSMPGQLLTDARVSLEQLSLVHDCDPAELACLGRIAKQLGVEAFVFGQLESEGSGAYARVKLFDASTQTVKRSTQVMFALRDASESDIARKAEGLAAQLLGDAPPSFVEAPARPAGVAVAATPSESGGGISGKRVAGYALLGGAALSVGLSVLSFVQIESSEQNESLQRYRRAVGHVDPSVADACDEADAGRKYGLDSSSFEEVRQKCSAGNTFEVLQYVFLGAAAVSGGLSAYFLLSDRGGQEAQPRSLLERFPVRPVIRHNAAEIRAKLSF